MAEQNLEGARRALESFPKARGEVPKYIARFFDPDCDHYPARKWLMRTEPRSRGDRRLDRVAPRNTGAIRRQNVAMPDDEFLRRIDEHIARGNELMEEVREEHRLNRETYERYE